MLIEEQSRVINGASAHDFQTIGDENRLETIKIYSFLVFNQKRFSTKKILDFSALVDKIK